MIPKALGGWLTTDQVCKTCNGFFGHQIERFVDHPLMLALRLEAGLPTSADEVWEFHDVEADDIVLGRLTPEGRVEPISPVYEGRGRVLIRGESPERVEGIVGKMRTRRQGRNFSTRPLPPFDAHVVRMRKPLGEAADLFPLIERDTAKIALEYIAYRAGRESAQRQELDPLRRWALEGNRISEAMVQYSAPTPLVRLPRSGRVLHIQVGQPATEEERDQLIRCNLGSAISEARPDIEHIPMWPGFEHRLALVRHNDRAFFRLTLFTAIVVTVPVPELLPLPWGCSDTRNLISDGPPVSI